MKKEFIYDQVFKACINSGVKNQTAKNAAIVATEKYCKGQYKGKVIDLISDSIKQAKKVKEK